MNGGNVNQFTVHLKKPPNKNKGNTKLRLNIYIFALIGRSIQFGFDLQINGSCSVSKSQSSQSKRTGETVLGKGVFELGGEVTDTEIRRKYNIETL